LAGCSEQSENHSHANQKGKKIVDAVWKNHVKNHSR